MITMRQAHDPRASLDRFRPRVEQALAVTRTHAFEDVVSSLADGTRLYEVMDDDAVLAVLVIHIFEFPKERILNVWIAAGQMADPDAVTAALDELAREQECARIWGDGRPGWSRLLQSKGWRPLSRSFERMVA